MNSGSVTCAATRYWDSRCKFGVALIVLLAIAHPVNADEGFSAWDIIPKFDWTGLYSGAHFSSTISSLNDGFDRDDFSGGAQIGYGLQFSTLYLGVEVDSAFGGTNSNYQYSPLYSTRVEVDWNTSLRGRVGIAYGSLLVYGTAGAAFGGQSEALYRFGQEAETVHHRRTGVVYGAGVEHKLLAGFTARAEVLRYDYSFENVPWSDQAANVLASQIRSTDSNSETVFRLGLSLKLN